MKGWTNNGLVGLKKEKKIKHNQQQLSAVLLLLSSLGPACHLRG